MSSDEAMVRPPSASEEMFRDLYSELWRLVDALERLGNDIENVHRVGALISGNQYQPGLLDAVDCLRRDVDWLSRNFYFRDKELLTELARINSKNVEGISLVVKEALRSMRTAPDEVYEQNRKINRRLDIWRAGFAVIGLITIIAGVGVIGYLAG